MDVVIGEDESDPVIYINDLLPHLGQEQNQKPLGTAIPAENLNLLLGTRPFPRRGQGRDQTEYSFPSERKKSTASPRRIFFLPTSPQSPPSGHGTWDWIAR